MSPLAALALVIALAAIVIGTIVGRPVLQERRRRALRGGALSNDRRAALRRNVPLYNRLPCALRDELEGHVQVLLAEKEFIGCEGLEVDENMRATIAGHAALLLLGRPSAYFPGLSAVLVYPSAFQVRHEQRDEDGVHSLRKRVLAGESWDRGHVVLSWEDVVHGAADRGDGYNVVLHEFAHQLDQESGVANGAPLLPRKEDYARWSRVMSEEYERLRAAGVHGVIDVYGAQDPAEFFAVATEAFFERGDDLARLHPELYAELSGYYGVDPRTWGTGE